MTDLDTTISKADKRRYLEKNFPKIEPRIIMKYLSESSWDLQKAW